MTYKNILVYFSLLVVLAFALWVRQFTFWQPHWQGDQSQYITLAMKLNEKGISGYNLTEAEINVRNIADSKSFYVTYPVFKKGIVGDFYKAYEMFGFNYYNEMPFYYKAPLFPTALSLSHKLLTPFGMPYVVVNLRKGYEPGDYRNPSFPRLQTWAVIVPLLSSLLVVLLTFVFAKKYFSNWTALTSAFLMAIHPVSITLSQKILADEFASMFMIASLYIFLIAYEKKSSMGSLLAGVVAGFGLLSRQTNGLGILTVWLFTIFLNEKAFSRTDWVGNLKIIFNKYFLFFFLGALFISFDWFIKVYGYYGHPLYEPDVKRKIMEDRTGWFEVLNKRPHAAILFSVGIPYLCPPFLFAYASIKRFFLELMNAIKKRTGSFNILFLWLWILPPYIFFMGRIESKEHRYMLMVYPALAILAAIYLESFYTWLKRASKKPWIAHAVIILFFMASAVWSYSIAKKTILAGGFLIYKPF